MGLLLGEAIITAEQRYESGVDLENQTKGGKVHKPLEIEGAEVGREALSLGVF